MNQIGVTMDDDNDVNLNAVFRNCNNNIKLFLSTIAKYTAKKSDSSTHDQTNVLELFASAFVSAQNAHKQSQKEAATHKTSFNTDNGMNDTSNKVQGSNDSLDMFESENIHNDDNNDNIDDDDIVPETQMFPEDSMDSGESVDIPFYSNNNPKNSLSADENDDESDDKIARVHADSAVEDFTESQSQMLMANLDQSLLHHFTTNMNGNLSKATSATRTAVAQNEAESSRTETDETNDDLMGDQRRVDRSESSTPDIDFLTQANVIDDQPVPEEPEKNKPDENDRNENDPNENDPDETQMFSQSIFDESVQQVIQAISPNKNASTEDIFLAVTQPPPVFKQPTAVSTPNKNSSTEDIFLAATQPPPVFKQPTAVSTPKIKSKQNVVAKQKSSPEKDDIYDEPTQLLESENSVSTKKTVTWERNVKSNAHENNNSEDIFNMETQAFVQPNITNNTTSNNASTSNDNQNETDVYGAETQILENDDDPFAMATQPMKMPVIAPTKRFLAISTQSSQPANTPEWSMAARVSNDELDMIEMQEKAVQKKIEKAKKIRHLFSSSSDEDENDDDLEFDLPNLVQQEPPKRSRKQANASDSDDAYDRNEDSVLKKSKVDNIQTIPKKVQLRRVSVKVSRDEVSKILETKMEKSNKTKNTNDRSNKTSTSTRKTSITRGGKTIDEPKFNPKIEDTKDNKSRRRSGETRTSSESNNKRKTESTDEIREKRVKKEKKVPREVAALLMKDAPQSKSVGDDQIEKSKKTEAKSRKTNRTKEEPKQEFTTLDSPTTNIRRNSDRLSMRNATRQAILFTKVNPSPYTRVIPKLGGCIVDTVQLGTILICDKVFRTFKFLYALSKGIPIVTSRWLDVSAQKGEFQPTDPYLLHDKNSEKRFQFSLKQSLETARHKPLFKNYHLFATPNVQPTKEEIAEIVECCGGKYAENLDKRRKTNTKAVLISNKKDSKLWREYQKVHPDIQIVSSEGFMQSIVKQKITFDEYLLS